MRCCGGAGEVRGACTGVREAARKTWGKGEGWGTTSTRTNAYTCAHACEPANPHTWDLPGCWLSGPDGGSAPG